MKKVYVFMILLGLAGGVTMTSCVRASKSCKANQKKIKKMRKSGQLNNF